MYAIVLLMALIALCHLMIAAMVGITTFLFVCFDAVCNKRIRRGIYLLTGMVLSFPFDRHLACTCTARRADGNE